MRFAFVWVVVALSFVGAEADEACKRTDFDPDTGERIGPTKATFILRKGTLGLIADRRSHDEDQLRAKVLACSQHDEQFKKLRKELNQRWNKPVVEYLGQLLLQDCDKKYGPSLRRPKAIVELLIYVHAHERPRGFIDNEDVVVTTAEQKRVAEVRKAAADALDKYYRALFDKDSKWPNESRIELQFNVTYALEEYGVPEMITETIWEGMATNDKFRFDMLGVFSNLSTEVTQRRLLEFSRSRKWPEKERKRIDMATKGVAWWLERQRLIAKKKRRREPAHGKVILSEEDRLLMLKRLADAKAGRGGRVKAVGAGSAKALVEDLTIAYVKRNIPLKTYFVRAGHVAAVGMFAMGRRELLVLDSPPNEKAMRLHGEKWRAMKPQEHLLGGRGVAIVVHSLNKIPSLTLGQVRAIFAGKVKDWRTLGGDIGLSPGGKGPPGGRGHAAAAPLTIQRYGLKRPNAAARLFHRKVLLASKCGKIQRQKTSKEVLADLSMDAQGIAFVDFSALPGDSNGDGVLDRTSVRILAISSVPAPSKAVAPTAATINSGAYPISRRLHLYVSPTASETAKDFVRFITAPGAAAATFRKHGLVPPPPNPKTKTKTKKKTSATTRPAPTNSITKARRPTPAMQPTDDTV